MDGLVLSKDIKLKIQNLHKALRVTNKCLSDLFEFGVNTNITIMSIQRPDSSPEQWQRVMQASHFIMIPQNNLRDDILSEINNGLETTQQENENKEEIDTDNEDEQEEDI